MGTIEIVQKAIKELTSGHFFLWRECSDYIDNEYAQLYSFIYVENETYVLKHKKYNDFAFVNARSPKEAFEKLMKKYEEAIYEQQLDEDE